MSNNSALDGHRCMNKKHYITVTHTFYHKSFMFKKINYNTYENLPGEWSVCVNVFIMIKYFSRERNLKKYNPNLAKIVWVIDKISWPVFLWIIIITIAWWNPEEFSTVLLSKWFYAIFVLFWWSFLNCLSLIVLTIMNKYTHTSISTRIFSHVL